MPTNDDTRSPEPDDERPYQKAAKARQAARATGRVSPVVAREAARSEQDLEDEYGREPGDRSDLGDLTEEDFLKIFREYSDQSVLPNLPPIEGYHVCWLTTNNARDTVAHRQRLGYSLIRMDELPGWDGASVKTGDYAGCVGINEMVAAKIPLRMYRAYLKEAHSTRPLAEESALRHKVESMKAELQDRNLRVVEEGDGTQSLGIQRTREMDDIRE